MPCAQLQMMNHTVECGPNLVMMPSFSYTADENTDTVDVLMNALMK